MSIFIKAGFWAEKIKGLKGELNLTQYITQIAESIIPPPSSGVQTVTGVQVNNTDPSNPIIKDYRDGKYKELYGLLTQNGGTNQLDAPNRLEAYPNNFLGSSVISSKIDVGVFQIQYTGPDANQFTSNKTMIFIGNNFADLGGNAPLIQAYLVDTSTIMIYSYQITATGPVLSDGIIDNLPIHIRVYN
jgi:hypothetical protein